MFADRLRLIRQKHGYQFPEAAATDTEITASEWEAMERGASPVEVLGRDGALVWLRRLAEITAGHSAELMEAAGLLDDARAERARWRVG